VTGRATNCMQLPTASRILTVGAKESLDLLVIRIGLHCSPSSATPGSVGYGSSRNGDGLLAFGDQNLGGPDLAGP